MTETKKTVTGERNAARVSVEDALEDAIELLTAFTSPTLKTVDRYWKNECRRTLIKLRNAVG